MHCNNLPKVRVVISKAVASCDDAILTFDGQQLLTIPSGDTANIDCTTLLNAVYITSNSLGHQHTGLFVLDGVVNSKDSYVKSDDNDRIIYYDGTKWVLEKLGGGSHTHDAANGNEDYPWEADWSLEDLVVDQASISNYCSNGGVCDDVSYSIVDTDMNVLYSGSISPGGALNQTIQDSTVENSDATYQTSVLAEGLLVTPDIDFSVNSVVEGSVPSVKDIDIELEDSLSNPITPTSVTMVGDVLTIEMPGSIGSYDLDLVDRFGNAFPTKQVSANATWDLRTLTPFDFADLFLNTLTGTYTAGEEQAIIDFVDDLNQAGIWQRRRVVLPFVGGNAFDNSLNLKYPFNAPNAGQMRFIGSPTHDSNGVTFGSTSAGVISFAIDHIPIQNKNFFVYSRTNNLPTGPAFDMATSEVGQVNQSYMGIRDNNADRALFAWDGVFNILGTNTDSRGGYHSNAIVGTNASKFVKNGNTSSPLITLTAGTTPMHSNLSLGATVLPRLQIQFPTSRNYAGAAIGLSLTDTQMQDDYDIWQQFQTDFNGRQV